MQPKFHGSYITFTAWHGCIFGMFFEMVNTSLSPPKTVKKIPQDLGVSKSCLNPSGLGVKEGINHGNVES